MLPWHAIHTVLLDMDGTLLDLHFDNVFFRETVPQVFAQQRGMDLQEAHTFIHDTYQSVAGTLAWYDLDYWSRVLDMDLSQLKNQSAHRICVLPQTMDFLHTLHTMGKSMHLVTNAHRYSLSLKLCHTPIGPYLTSITSSHELGHPKESAEFWPLLQSRMGFNPANTLLVDDSEPVLHAARHFGLGHLYHISAPSSALPSNPSEHFYSVRHVGALLPHDAT